jgi:hypothetical protein
MRSEAGAVLDALDEAIRIGREAHIPVEIWHLKAAGRQNWGRMKEIVAKIEAARRDGVDITADTYAYPAWFNSFSAFIPPWAHAGGDEKLLERLKDPQMRARITKEMLAPGEGGWDNEWQEIPGPEAVTICVVQNAELKSLQGKTLADVAKLWKKDPIETLFDILVKDHAYTEVAVFGMSEPDIALAVSQPWVSFDNDSQGTAPTGLLGEEHPHPRAYGTFPRVIRKFVREDKLLSLEEAIRKMTAPRAEDAARRPRRAQGRNVGRPRRLRSRSDRRQGDVREPEPVVDRDGLRAGERRGGSRRRRHQRASRQGPRGPGADDRASWPDARGRSRRRDALRAAGLLQERRLTVAVYTTVTDASGRLVPDLTRDSFEE